MHLPKIMFYGTHYKQCVFKVAEIDSISLNKINFDNIPMSGCENNLQCWWESGECEKVVVWNVQQSLTSGQAGRTLLELGLTWSHWSPLVRVTCNLATGIMSTVNR